MKHSRARLQLTITVALLQLSLPSVARADDADCAALGTDVSVPRGAWLTPRERTEWHARALPDRGDIGGALNDLDYGDELPNWSEIDLDGDGAGELLIGPAAQRLCGSGGCPYILLAGRHARRIGTFFGELVALDRRINGYPVIQSYSRVISYATAIETWVFDGREYVLVARLYVESCGLQLWTARMRP